MTRSANLKILVFLWTILLFPLHLSAAVEREPVSLKVLPMHVGVFYELKTQQFQAIATFADGSEEDYTDKVGWSLKCLRC